MKSILRNIVPVFLFTSLLSCQQMPEDSPEGQAMAKLNIHASFIEKNEISSWGSAGEQDYIVNGEQQASRAADDPASRLAFFLIDKNGNQILTQEKAKTDNGFATLYAEVPVGTYELVAFGHNGDANVTLDASKQITPSGKVTDSFLYYQQITLDEETSNAQDIVLDRCVAKFTLVHTDAIPTGTATIEFVITGTNNVIKTTTGFAPSASNQTITINIPSNSAGTKNNKFAFFTFLTSEESTVDITATAKDTQGNTIVSHTFEDVELEVNMQTIYTGVFFHGDQNISASFNKDWKDNNEIPF